MCSKDIMESADPPTLSHVKTNEAESFSRESPNGDVITDLSPNHKAYTSSKQANRSKKKSADQKYGEDLIVRGSRHRLDHTSIRDSDAAEDQGSAGQSNISFDRSCKRSVTGVSQNFDFPSLSSSWSQPHAGSRSSGMAHKDCAVSTSSSSGIERSCTLRELPTNPEALTDVKNHFIFSDSDGRSCVDLNGSDSGSSSGRNRQSGSENCHTGAHERESEARNGTKDYRGGGQIPGGSTSSSTSWVGAAGGRVNGISAGSGIGSRGAGRTRAEGRRSKPPPVVEVGRNGNQNRDVDGGRRKNFDTKSNGQQAAAAAAVAVASHTRLTEGVFVNHNSSGDLVHHGVNGCSSCEDSCSPDLTSPLMTHGYVHSRQGVPEPLWDNSVPGKRGHVIPETGNSARPSFGEAAGPLATVIDVLPRQVGRLDEVKGSVKSSSHSLTRDVHAKTSQESIANFREHQLPEAKFGSIIHHLSDTRDRTNSSSGGGGSSGSSGSSSRGGTFGSRRSEEQALQAKFSNTTTRNGHNTQDTQTQNVGAPASGQPGNGSAVLVDVPGEGDSRQSKHTASDHKSKVVAFAEIAKEGFSTGPVVYKRIQSGHKNGEVVGPELFSQPGSQNTGLKTRAPLEASVNGIVSRNRRSRSSCRSVEDFASLDGCDRAVEEVSTTTYAASSPRSLRRLRSFPSRGEGSEPDDSSSCIQGKIAGAKKQHSSNAEPAANLRGLLPKAKTLVSSAKTRQSSDESAKSLVGGGEQQARVVGAAASDSVPSGSSGCFSNHTLSFAAAHETGRSFGPALDAVRVSCEGRRIAQDIARDVGYPMAEFERVLEAVAPGFSCPLGDPCNSAKALEAVERTPRGSGGNKGLRIMGSSPRPQYGVEDEFSICRCRVADVPLSSIWQWYEEPSFYGAAVKSCDERRTPKDEVEELPFVAYFVPYLSATQLFGYSLDAGMSGGDGSTGGKQKMSQGSSFPHSQTSSNSDMLATLLPSPGRSDESSSPSPSPSLSQWKEAASPVVGQVADGNNDSLGNRLLYEFSDSEMPQMRQPLFPKVEELSKGIIGSKSHSSGDPKCLEKLRVGDIHPASWFAVAWYPIYRISEGPLRTVFLTYHSFNHFAPRRTMITQTEGTARADDVFLPVVGLECYNFQWESWLSMGGRFSKEATKTSRKSPLSFVESLQNRLTSLQAVAAVMGKGIPSDAAAVPTIDTESTKFSHPDYEFFVKRRR